MTVPLEPLDVARPHWQGGHVLLYAAILEMVQPRRGLDAAAALTVRARFKFLDALELIDPSRGFSADGARQPRPPG